MVQNTCKNCHKFDAFSGFGRVAGFIPLAVFDKVIG